MKIIISPAKKMNINTDEFPVEGLPAFLEETRILQEKICSLSYEEAGALWKCNEKLTQLNYERFQHMDLKRGLTPALLSYEGLQYQHMAPVIFTDTALAYVREHLRILSGFYGVLKPFDGVTPYRLEMQAPLLIGENKNLYEFWKDRIYRELLDEDRVILNLASKEYSKVVEKYLTKEDRFITLVFGELSGGKVRQKGTMAKMARGEMVRYLAVNNITDLEKIKDFTGSTYEFSEEYSNEKEWVFLLKNEKEDR